MRRLAGWRHLVSPVWVSDQLLYLTTSLQHLSNNHWEIGFDQIIVFYHWRLDWTALAVIQLLTRSARSAWSLAQNIPIL